MSEKTAIHRADAINLLAWQKLLSLDSQKRKDIVAEMLSHTEKADEEIEEVHVDSEEYNQEIIEYFEAHLLNVTNEYLSEDLRELYHHDVVVTGEPAVYETCYCCGFRTIEDRGQYDVCPNCYWEDDGMMIRQRIVL